MSAVYERNFELHSEIPEGLAQQAARSIGDSYLVAHQLVADQGAK